MQVPDPTQIPTETTSNVAPPTTSAAHDPRHLQAGESAGPRGGQPEPYGPYQGPYSAQDPYSAQNPYSAENTEPRADRTDQEPDLPTSVWSILVVSTSELEEDEPTAEQVRSSTTPFEPQDLEALGPTVIGTAIEAGAVLLGDALARVSSILDPRVEEPHEPPRTDRQRTTESEPERHRDPDRTPGGPEDDETRNGARTTPPGASFPSVRPESPFLGFTDLSRTLEDEWQA